MAPQGEESGWPLVALLPPGHDVAVAAAAYLTGPFSLKCYHSKAKVLNETWALCCLSERERHVWVWTRVSCEAIHLCTPVLLSSPGSASSSQVRNKGSAVTQQTPPGRCLAVWCAQAHRALPRHLTPLSCLPSVPLRVTARGCIYKAPSPPYKSHIFFLLLR